MSRAKFDSHLLSGRIGDNVGKSMVKKKEKDANAVALGRKGGKARSKKLTAEQRKEIARKAAQARWSPDQPLRNRET
jgi:hypothetical protein